MADIEPAFCKSETIGRPKLGGPRMSFQSIRWPSAQEGDSQLHVLVQGEALLNFATYSILCLFPPNTRRCYNVRTSFNT